MEMDVLNAVDGGQDDHSSLRYRFCFVDITRTMTPMVGLPVIDSNRSFSLSSTQSFFLGSIGRLMGGRTVQDSNSYAQTY